LTHSFPDHPERANQARTLYTPTKKGKDPCKHCLYFEENVLPQLRQALGAQLDVERLNAAIDMEPPRLLWKER
jgi:hypothetical protein